MGQMQVTAGNVKTAGADGLRSMNHGVTSPAVARRARGDAGLEGRQEHPGAVGIAIKWRPEAAVEGSCAKAQGEYEAFAMLRKSERSTCFPFSQTIHDAHPRNEPQPPPVQLAFGCVGALEQGPRGDQRPADPHDPWRPRAEMVGFRLTAPKTSPLVATRSRSVMICSRPTRRGWRLPTSGS